jgi:hypothetical protein
MATDYFDAYHLLNSYLSYFYNFRTAHNLSIAFAGGVNGEE